jgi:hypothetical protein
MLVSGGSFESCPNHLKLSRALVLAYGEHDWAIEIESFLGEIVAFHVQRADGRRRSLALDLQTVRDTPEADLSGLLRRAEERFAQAMATSANYSPNRLVVSTK